MDVRRDPEAWETLQVHEEFSNRWVGITVEDVLLPDGNTYEYTRLRPAGIGVAIAAFNRVGQILLEREYRHGVGEVIWQLPGGLADPGEDLRAAALRELLEESGHAPVEGEEYTVRYLGSVWDNPGLGPAESHIVAVRDVVKQREQKLETAEFISLHWRDSAWLKEAVRTNIIRERTTVAAVAYLMLNRWI